MKYRTTIYWVTLAAVGASMALSTGCARTARGRRGSVKTSGFMDDYTLLKKTKGDIAQLFYINEMTDWERYTKVIVEPVTIWRVPGSKLEELPQNELDELGSFFHNALKTELAKDYEVVNEVSVGTLRIRVALTEADKSKVVLDVISSVLPVGLATSYGQKLTFGTHSFVGKATAEAEIRSAVSGELLAAGVTRRVGGKSFDTGVFSSWNDVKAATDEWAVKCRENLQKAREGTLQYEQ